MTKFLKIITVKDTLKIIVLITILFNGCNLKKDSSETTSIFKLNGFLIKCINSSYNYSIFVLSNDSSFQSFISQETYSMVDSLSKNIYSSDSAIFDSVRMKYLPVLYPVGFETNKDMKYILNKSKKFNGSKGETYFIKFFKDQSFRIDVNSENNMHIRKTEIGMRAIYPLDIINQEREIYFQMPDKKIIFNKPRNR